MATYYNEIDPFCADWLKNLIQAGHIPPGDVDIRDINDVQPADLAPYRQCHFFAGIAGWPHALRLSGWPDDRPVWTGSCPCQPYSVAGRRLGRADHRDLWPAWRRLILACRPGIVFGEQVASRDALSWLDTVCDDLEAAHYTVGAADLCAAGTGAPHVRQRLYWLGYTDRPGRQWPEPQPAPGQPQPADPSRDDGRMGHPGRPGLAFMCVEPTRQELPPSQRASQTGPATWSDFEWLSCGPNTRPTQPGLFPLAYGISGRVGRVRAYGNAIVPPLAATFIAAANHLIEDFNHGQRQ
jgi:DNA (cytosine-5)-methyltransferase 1